MALYQTLIANEDVYVHKQPPGDLLRMTLAEGRMASSARDEVMEQACFWWYCL